MSDSFSEGGTSSSCAVDGHAGTLQSQISCMGNSEYSDVVTNYSLCEGLNFSFPEKI